MADSRYQRMLGRYEHAATLAAEAASFIRPEILSLPSKKLTEYLKAKQLQPFRLQLERLVRYKPHTLTPGEEKLLAMQSEMAGAADRVFRQLTDADLNSACARTKKANRSSFALVVFEFPAFAQPQRPPQGVPSVLRAVSGPRNSLAAAYSSSVQKDVYYAKARSYPRPAKARCFTTTCRWRCTTISSQPSAASCRRSTSISTSAAER